MAAPSPLQSLREEALCAICLDYFKDPVSIGCGHNFCRGCVTQLWGQEDEREQPPPLRRHFIREVLYQTFPRREDLFRRHEPRVGDGRRRHWANVDVTWDEEEEPNYFRRGLVCDLRIRVIPEDRVEPRRYHNRGENRFPEHLQPYPNPRLRPPPRTSQVFTCPQCRKTFPSRSFRPNLQLANMVQIIREMRPTPQDEQSICSKHQEAMKLFCEVDKKPICLVCRESRHHKYHSVVPLDEVFEEYVDRRTRRSVVPRSSSNVPAWRIN